MQEEHQGLKVCCPEEIAYKHCWINKETLLELLNGQKNCQILIVGSKI